MWVTRRTDYATRAVLALAMAEDAMNLDQLAEATESPRSVLEQVMPASAQRASLDPFVALAAATASTTLPKSSRSSAWYGSSRASSRRSAMRPAMSPTRVP